MVGSTLGGEDIDRDPWDARKNLNYLCLGELVRLSEEVALELHFNERKIGPLWQCLLFVIWICSYTAWHNVGNQYFYLL